MALRLPRLVAQDSRVRPGVAPAALAVRPEVVRAIAAASAGAGLHETGGPLFGTVQRSWSGSAFFPLVSILGTVPPGPGVDGRLASVCLGSGGDGERSASALRWLRATTGLDLLHLGDWHAHPSGHCEPSLGDERTAFAMGAASGGPVWLTAIAVSRPHRREEVSVVAKQTVRHTSERLDTADVGFFQLLGRALVPLTAVIESDSLPRLPPLPWHVADPVRFSAECRLLDAAGYRLAVDGSANGVPGLCLRVQRDGSRPLTVVTGLQFPEREPELFDHRGRRRTLRSAWSADRFLVDIVREVSS